MKHNGTLAKERELKLVECLNTNLDDPKFNQIANYINNELEYNFDSFSHSGSIQTEPGDILGYVGDEIIPIEIKILDTAKSTESHGGGGRDVFKMLNPNILGYKEFEDKVRVAQKRWDIINEVLGTNINSYKEQDNLKDKIKSNPTLLNGREGKLATITTETVNQYNDYLISFLSNINHVDILSFCNAIFLGYRKDIDKLKNIKNNIIEVQVGNFLNDDIIITHKTFTPKTEIKNIYRKGKALFIEFNKGYIKFPWTHGNGYQGSGKTLSCKYMFKY
tara:strand:+ start:68 stop:898 length:831 start_codon:yes stop_codon:yes gene_type:complete